MIMKNLNYIDNKYWFKYDKHIINITNQYSSNFKIIFNLLNQNIQIMIFDSNLNMPTHKYQNYYFNTKFQNWYLKESKSIYQNQIK